MKIYRVYSTLCETVSSLNRSSIVLCIFTSIQSILFSLTSSPYPSILIKILMLTHSPPHFLMHFTFCSLYTRSTLLACNHKLFCCLTLGLKQTIHTTRPASLSINKLLLNSKCVYNYFVNIEIPGIKLKVYFY